MFTGRQTQSTQYVVHTAYRQFFAVDSSSPSPREIHFREHSNSLGRRIVVVFQAVGCIRCLGNCVSGINSHCISNNILELGIGNSRTSRVDGIEGIDFSIGSIYVFNFIDKPCVAQRLRIEVGIIGIDNHIFCVKHIHHIHVRAFFAL